MGLRPFVAPLASVGLGLVWIGLALRSSTTTYHLFPAAVASGWPVALHRSRGRVRPRVALLAGAGGLSVAFGTTFALAAGDALRGPALGGSALVESLLVALAGAAVAVRWVDRDRTGRSVQGPRAHQAQHDQEEPDGEQHE